MEMHILESSKNELKAELENVTLAEILRVYLNKDSDVSFAAWKREHITKKPVILIKTRGGTSSSTNSSKSQIKGKTVKKAIADAVDKITKDLDKLEAEFKKIK